jgi:general secretion pathway protein E
MRAFSQRRIDAATGAAAAVSGHGAAGAGLNRPRIAAIVPAMQPAAETASDRKLTLAEVLNDLVADGIVGRAEADKLIADRRMQRADHHPLAVIADQKWKSLLPPNTLLHLELLTEWLAAKVGLGYYHIDPLKINFSAVTDIMSNAYAQRFKILPVEVNTREAVIATCEPYVKEWERELKPILRLDIRRVIANPLDIARYQVEFYNLAKSIKGASEKGDQRSGIGNFEQLVELGNANRQYDANDQHIVHVVDWLWQYAFDQRASDIHMEPRRDVGLVRFRLDGVLHQVYQIPSAVMSAMTSRIKILGRMDVVEKRRPQDGRIKTRTADGQEIELRLSTLPTAFGEKLVMRVFDPEVLVKDFSELGFSDEDKLRWGQMTVAPHGIILVTGPTGSGKTTTLYSTLKTLATEAVNVCTIEDPIEMVEPAFNQMQVTHGIDLGFADGVRALMRQDPDIIMVGEIRDLETADMAIQAALTGHLVLSTLHTNDSVAAITRLLDLGVPSYLLNSTILGVMAQRLVRTLCPHCKQSVPYDDARAEDLTWEEFVAPWKAKRPAHIFRPVGCLECRNTGYIGRIGIYEILLMTPAMRRLVDAKADLAAMRELAYKEGMKPLRISAAMKVAAGLTTIEEALKVAPPPRREKD